MHRSFTWYFEIEILSFSRRIRFRETALTLQLLHDFFLHEYEVVCQVGRVRDFGVNDVASGLHKLPHLLLRVALLSSVTEFHRKNLKCFAINFWACYYMDSTSFPLSTFTPFGLWSYRPPNSAGITNTCGWCYKTFLGGNRDFPKIKKWKKVCSDVWTYTKMWKQC